jgi:hypothetical protein
MPMPASLASTRHALPLWVSPQATSAMRCVWQRQGGWAAGVVAGGRCVWEEGVHTGIGRWWRRGGWVGG